MPNKHIYTAALKVLPILLPICLRSQELRLSAGVQLVATGAPNLVLNNISLINDGGFTADSSTVIFRSDAGVRIGGNTFSGARIGGNSPLSFYNLTVGGSSGDLRLANNIAVAGHVTMDSGNLQLNHYRLDLGGTGSIWGERALSCITGLDGGTITVTASLAAPQSINPGNIGVELSSPENLGLTVITRGHTPQTNADGTTGIQRYFDFVPSTNAHLHATLRFFYLDGELGASNKNELAVFSNTAGQSGWISRGKDAADIIANSVTKSNIDELHRFTLATEFPKTAEKAAAQVFPNPAGDKFTLVFFSALQKDAFISLYDAAGNQLELRKTHCQPGTNTIEWPIGRYAAGVYRVAFDNMDIKPAAVIKQ